MDGDAALNAPEGSIRTPSRTPIADSSTASSGGIVTTPKSLTRGDAAKQGIDVGVLGESEAGKLVRYFQRVDGKSIYQKDAATACNMSPSTFNNKYAQWISQGKPAFLAPKSSSSGGRPKLLNEGQLGKFKIEVGKRSMEGRGYTLKSGEFAHDLRKYARATLKDAGDLRYKTKSIVMSERVVSNYMKQVVPEKVMRSDQQNKSRLLNRIDAGVGLGTSATFFSAISSGDNDLVPGVHNGAVLPELTFNTDALSIISFASFNKPGAFFAEGTKRRLGGEHFSLKVVSSQVIGDKIKREAQEQADMSNIEWTAYDNDTERLGHDSRRVVASSSSASTAASSVEQSTNADLEEGDNFITSLDSTAKKGCAGGAMAPVGFSIDVTTSAAGGVVSVIVTVKERDKVPGYFKAYKISELENLLFVVRATKVNEQELAREKYKHIWSCEDKARTAVFRDCQGMPVSVLGKAEDLENKNPSCLRMVHTMDGCGPEINEVSQQMMVLHDPLAPHVEGGPPPNTDLFKGPNAGTALFQPNDVSSAHMELRRDTTTFHKDDVRTGQDQLLPRYVQLVFSICKDERLSAARRRTVLWFFINLHRKIMKAFSPAHITKSWALIGMVPFNVDTTLKRWVGYDSLTVTDFSAINKGWKGLCKVACDNGTVVMSDLKAVYPQLLASVHQNALSLDSLTLLQEKYDKPETENIPLNQMGAVHFTNPKFLQSRQNKRQTAVAVRAMGVVAGLTRNSNPDGTPVKSLSDKFEASYLVCFLKEWETAYMHLRGTNKALKDLFKVSKTMTPQSYQGAKQIAQAARPAVVSLSAPPRGGLLVAHTQASGSLTALGSNSSSSSATQPASTSQGASGRLPGSRGRANFLTSHARSPTMSISPVRMDIRTGSASSGGQGRSPPHLLSPEGKKKKKKEASKQDTPGRPGVSTQFPPLLPGQGHARSADKRTPKPKFFIS